MRKPLTLEQKEAKRIADKKYKDSKKEELKIKNAEYRKVNSDKHTIWRKANPDKIKANKKKSYEKNLDINRKKKIKYYQDNKTSINEKVLKKLHSDSLFKLKHYSRNIVRKALVRKGYVKDSKTIQILGCTYEEFKAHLESKFEPWMNWDNYGLYNGELNHGWDIDHIVPLSTAKTEQDIIKLNHFSNLQPLCSKVNRHLKSWRV